MTPTTEADNTTALQCSCDQADRSQSSVVLGVAQMHLLSKNTAEFSRASHNVKWHHEHNGKQIERGETQMTHA